MKKEKLIIVKATDDRRADKLLSHVWFEKSVLT